MSRTAIAKGFMNQIINLVNSLHDRFPEVKEIKLTLTGLKTLKSFNPKKGIEFFVLHGYKYRDAVMKRDESVFESKNITSELTKIKDLEDIQYAINHYNIKETDYEGVDVMELLQKYWSKFEPAEIENVWKYAQVLMTLCDNYIALSLQKNKTIS
jgi:hypothetical protein